MGAGMRKPLGILLLVLGVGGLGLWARGHEARAIEHRITAGAGQVAQGTVHAVAASVAGRDITVSGLADSEAEKAAILTALDRVPGRRVVRDDLRVLPSAQPYRLTLDKPGAGGAMTLAGNTPSEAFREALAGMSGAASDGLQLASGAPAGWADHVQAAVAALAPLESGSAEMLNDRLRISGIARSPAEVEALQAALAAVPRDNVEVDLRLLDDGSPPVWTLDYDAGGAVRLAGKLPPGVEPGQVAAALGVGSMSSDAVQGLLGPAGSVALPAALARWLPALETLRASFGPAGAEIEAGVGRGVDRDALAAAMAPDLAAVGVPVMLGVVEARVEAQEGATRTHALSGEVQEYRRGWWLPRLELSASLETCSRLANDVLGAATVNFVPASDALDASAREVISRLAAVLGPCTREGGLTALIGGHTDSTGNAELNLGLSQRRATAVRLALVDRGVPAAALRAQGYGAGQPVASNETEEGRAANRRTTIEWSE